MSVNGLKLDSAFSFSILRDLDFCLFQTTTTAAQVLPYVDDEFEYWHTNCSTVAHRGAMTANVYQYVTKSNTPRPESYKEDVEVTQGMNAGGCLVCDFEELVNFVIVAF